MQVTDKIVARNDALLVSLADFKQHINWDADDVTQDTVMTAYLKAATEEAQLFTGRQFLTATWSALFDVFPWRANLPKTPVIDNDSIEVKYYDTLNVLRTLAASEYKIKDGGTHGFTQIIFDGDIPSIYDRPDAIVIEYEVGYGAAATDVPQQIIVAIMILAANYFANRESEQAGTTVVQLINGADKLLFPYKTFYHNYNETRYPKWGT